jgi:hypothetical protein
MINNQMMIMMMMMMAVQEPEGQYFWDGSISLSSLSPSLKGVIRPRREA